MKVFKFVALLILAWLILACSLLPLAAHGAEIGTCEPDEKGASIYWPIKKGRLLLAEIKELRLQKEKFSLIEKKLELKDELIGFWKLQLDAAETVIKKQASLETVHRARISALEASAAKWQQEAAQARAERIWWAVGGAGSVVVLGVVVVVVVLVAR